MSKIKKLNQIDYNFSIQNRFTAYLKISLHHRRINYIKVKELLQCELSIDFDTLYEPNEKGGIRGCVDSPLFSYALNWDDFLDMEQQIENDLLLSAFKKLTDKQRNILLLKAVDGLTFEEIATKTNISISQIKGIYFYALKVLRKNFIYNERGNNK